MFSAEYNVAAALLRGGFGLAELEPAALTDAELLRLTRLARVQARKPGNVDIVYDPLDPDSVEVTLQDGRCLRSETKLPTGMPGKPMSDAARRAKFDACVAPCRNASERAGLWQRLCDIEAIDDIGRDLEL